MKQIMDFLHSPLFRCLLLGFSAASAFFASLDHDVGQFALFATITVVVAIMMVITGEETPR